MLKNISRDRAHSDAWQMAARTRLAAAEISAQVTETWRQIQATRRLLDRGATDDCVGEPAGETDPRYLYGARKHRRGGGRRLRGGK
jgi:hypothetical protein